MIEAVLRRVPLPAYRPLRQAIHDLPRRHPMRMLATQVLRHAARAYRHQLPELLDEIRPLDKPALSFEAVDSMVMEAVFWFGVRGYEGTVAHTWTMLCAQATSVLEIGGNVGLFSVIGGLAGSGCYTVVEPVPAAVTTLRANLGRNDVCRVNVVQAAVIPGMQSQRVMLNLPDEGRSLGVGAHLVEQVEVADRGTRTQIEVEGVPIRQLALGRDLIKIDAEGIEAALLADILPMLVKKRPVLLIEVLPEAAQLGVFLADLAQDAGYQIHILPEYGADKIVTVPAQSFTSCVPRQHRSKDIVLSIGHLS